MAACLAHTEQHQFVGIGTWEGTNRTPEMGEAHRGGLPQGGRGRSRLPSWRAGVRAWGPSPLVEEAWASSAYAACSVRVR